MGDVGQEAEKDEQNIWARYVFLSVHESGGECDHSFVVVAGGVPAGGDDRNLHHSIVLYYGEERPPGGGVCEPGIFRRLPQKSEKRDSHDHCVPSAGGGTGSGQAVCGSGAVCGGRGFQPGVYFIDSGGGEHGGVCFPGDVQVYHEQLGVLPPVAADGVPASAFYGVDAGNADCVHMPGSPDSGAHAVYSSGGVLLWAVFSDGAAAEEVYGEAADGGRGG